MINKNYSQIDILDSICSNYSFHRMIASKIRMNLSKVISVVANGHPKFDDWSLPIIHSLPQQNAGSNDCAFFMMMFMKFYNPDSRQLQFCDHVEFSKDGQLRIDILWYLFHHQLNGSRESQPEGIM